MTIHLLYGLIFSKKKTGSIFWWYLIPPFPLPRVQHLQNKNPPFLGFRTTRTNRKSRRILAYFFKSWERSKSERNFFWEDPDLSHFFSFKDLDVPWAFDSLCLLEAARYIYIYTYLYIYTQVQTKCLSLCVLSIQLVDYNINSMHLASAVKFQLSFSVWTHNPSVFEQINMFFLEDSRMSLTFWSPK